LYDFYNKYWEQNNTGYNGLVHKSEMRMSLSNFACDTLTPLGHFSGKNHVKFGNFVNFSGKYYKSLGTLLIFPARIK